MIDFGFSFKYNKAVFNKGKGTDGFMPPENDVCCDRGLQANKVDVFAIGVIAFYMACKCMPFKTASLSDKKYRMFAQHLVLHMPV